MTLTGRIYLNVGHTGLNAAGLERWLARRQLKPVYLIHDLIPITHPGYCRPGEASRHATRMRQALRSARGIIVNSEATGAELTGFARSEGLAAPKMLAALLGIERLAAGTGISPRSHPYFLCIGTIEGRKNHILLLHIWEMLKQELGAAAPELILVGQRGWEADDVFAMLDHPTLAKVIELDACDDAQLANLLDHARALLMPSFAEGFGLPVLEAMARGTPVIASDIPVFREITQAIPCLIAPDDMVAWRRAILNHLTDSPAREAQRRKLADFAPPSWADHIASVRRWLTTL